jgi:hypothetical protein
MSRLARTWMRLAVCGSAALLTAAFGAPAVAATPDPGKPIVVQPPSLWDVAPCATGDLTGAATLDGDGRRHLTLTGWIQPCADTKHTNGYGMAYYYADTAVVSWALSPYATLSGPTAFVATASFGPVGQEPLETSYGPLAAVCVVRGPISPVACVRLTQPDSGPPTFAPISTGDPLITSVPVQWRNNTWVQDQTCGNCV